jgi:hypothetical protein
MTAMKKARQDAPTLVRDMIGKISVIVSVASETNITFRSIHAHLSYSNITRTRKFLWLSLASFPS